MDTHYYFFLDFFTYSQTQYILFFCLLQMLTEDLLQLALAKAQGEETAQAHSVSCSIFGAIAPLLDGKLIMQTYLHKAMALCQVSTKFLIECLIIVPFCISKRSALSKQCGLLFQEA